MPIDPATPAAGDESSGGDSPLSLKRLTAAFAQMFSAPAAVTEGPPSTPPDPCEISPRSIVEAVLFVGAGAESTTSRSAEELAAAMRDVTPDEVHQAVGELNTRYEQDAAPYHIVSGPSGFQLRLRPEMERLRDKFYGRIKESRLSPAALEVLSIVAYKQPVSSGRIDEMRGARSQSLVASLVRRGLVRIDRAADKAVAPVYHTTDRFLRLFGLSSAAQLPRAAEMEDS